MSSKVKSLPPLAVGTRVLVQNQTGLHRNRWDRSGVVVEAKPHSQYLVKVDGSGRVTLRNRRFLRRVEQHQGAEPYPSIGADSDRGRV